MADAGVTATLLPIAAFYLKLGRFAPARALIDAGVPVALATDVNPGGGFSPSMPFAMALACFGMNMTFEEALAAATINAAWSLDRADGVGSLEEGKQMDAVFVRGDPINLIRVGAPAIAAVIKRGVCVAGSFPAADRSVMTALLELAVRRSSRLLPFADTRRPEGDRRRRWRAPSVRRCWRWWPACRSRARTTPDDEQRLAAAGSRCAAHQRSAGLSDGSRQRRLR